MSKTKRNDGEEGFTATELVVGLGIVVPLVLLLVVGAWKLLMLVVSL